MNTSLICALLVVCLALPAQAWEFQLKAPSAGAPLLLKREGAFVVADESGMVHCLSTTGSLKWWYRTNAPFSTGPVRLGSRRIAVGSQNGHLYIFDLQGNREDKVDLRGVPVQLLNRADGGLYGLVKAGDTQSRLIAFSQGRLKWEKTLNLTASSELALVSRTDVVVGTKDGSVWSYDRKGVLRWKTKLEKALVGRLASDAQGIVAANSAGQILRLDSRGRRKWRRDLHAQTWGVVADNTTGKFLVGAKDDLIALHGDGRQAWSRRLDGPVVTPPPRSDKAGWLVLTQAGGLHRLDHLGKPLGVDLLTVPPKVTPQIFRSNILMSSARSFKSSKGPVGRADTTLEQSQRRFAGLPQGNVLWRQQLSGRGSAGVVTLKNGDLVVATRDDRLLMLDPRGKARWRYQCDGSIAEPPVQTASGGVVFVCGADLHLVDAQGALIHQLPLKRGSRLAPRNDRKGNIIVASGKELLALSGKGKILWRIPTQSPIMAPAAFGPADIAYVGSRDTRLYAVRGGRTLWARETGGSLRAAPVVAPEGELLLPSMDQHLYALDRHNGRVRWRYQTDGQVDQSPIVRADGSILVASTNGSVSALTGKGRAIWRFRAGTRFTTPPLLTRFEDLVLGTADGIVFALGNNGKPKWWIQLDAAPVGPIASSKNGNLIVVTRQGTLWKFRPPSPKERTAPGAISANYLPLKSVGPVTAFGENMALVAGHDATLTILKRHPSRAGAAWSLRLKRRLGFYPLNAASALADRFIVSDRKGILSAFNGEKYHYRIRLSRSALGTPRLISEGRTTSAIVGSAEGDVWVLNSKGEVRWQKNISGIISRRPLLHSDGEILVVAAGDTLVAFGRHGQRRWSYRATGTITVDPTLLGNSIAIGDGRGQMTALSKQGKVLWRRQMGRAIVELHPSSSGMLGLVRTSGGRVVILSAKGEIRCWPTLARPAQRVAWFGSTPWFIDGAGTLHRIKRRSCEIVREYPTPSPALDIHALPPAGVLVVDQTGHLRGLGQR